MFISNLSGTGNALPKFGTWIGADADLREKMTSKQKTELIDVQSKFVFDTIKTDGNIQFVEGDKVPGTVVAIGYPEIKKALESKPPLELFRYQKPSIILILGRQ